MNDTACPGAGEAPSSWIVRHAGLAAPACTALDLACGRGRHARFLAGRGHQVLAVDRDAVALAGLAGLAGVTTRCADLEDGAWPLSGESFGLVVVTRYLWRPRVLDLIACVGDGGVLLYETFTRGHERLGRPMRAEFLLEAGELLDLARGWADVIAHEQCTIDGAKPALVQRLAARRSTRHG
ncbi:MAG: methyltransferase domain-containing protein [Planctomycetes bacterium]|nr:methyltransferase domain-containing protein [Planctomycetota bacterium]